MKKTLLLLGLSTMVLKAFCQPVITNVSYPSSVGLFGLYEISFNLGHYSNPYDPDTISAYAIFCSPDNTTTVVPAFYYEGYSFQQSNDGYEIATYNSSDVGWRIRFTPTIIGNWSFTIVAEDLGGSAIMPNNGLRPFCFTCSSVNNANGFISTANSRYLKRSVFRNGRIRDKSFYPVGPNIAWYSCTNGNWAQPHGIYGYERYIDSLTGNGNYMRIWLNRYQYLNLYGPEYTQGSIVYFDSILNQKDAAELDHIVAYAAQHDIALMMCVFSFGDFRVTNGYDPSNWNNNPYHTIVTTPCEFFTDTKALKITKNLFRYIVARWGYATNVMSWELWNEVSNMFSMCDNGSGQLQQNVLDWHEEMVDYIRTIDPFQHCITTSMGTKGGINHNLYLSLFEDFDFVQLHNYQNIQKAKSKEQLSKTILDTTIMAHNDYPSKPFFMGEFGFGQGTLYAEKDPFGIDLHNSLWSSMFSSSMGPSSFWWWHYVDTMSLYNRFKPLLTFCNSLPILSDSFEADITGHIENNRLLVFPNNIATYYMKNDSETEIYGWCQDTAFCYQSLRWLTDLVYPPNSSNGLAWHFMENGVFDPNGYVYTLNPAKKPQPSSSSNIIALPIVNQPIGTAYKVTWYNTETGLPYTSVFSPGQQLQQTPILVQQDLDGSKFIEIEFPQYIRDLKNHIINNTFGDAVFVISLWPNDSKEK